MGIVTRLGAALVLIFATACQSTPQIQKPASCQYAYRIGQIKYIKQTAVGYSYRRYLESQDIVIPKESTKLVHRVGDPEIEVVSDQCRNVKWWIIYVNRNQHLD